MLHARKSLTFGVNDPLFIFRANFAFNNLTSSNRKRWGVLHWYGHSCERLCALWMALRNDCLLNGVCYIRAAFCTRSEASQILGPSSLSLSQLSVTPDDFHLLAESTGVKSLSRNGHLLMATWHMKWLLLCDSLGVRQRGSRPATVSSFDCQTPVRFR